MKIRFQNKLKFLIVLMTSLLIREVAIAQNSMGPIIGNQGIVTQGQQGNNTIIQGPQRLKFSESIGTELLRYLSDKKPVRITAIGSPSDQAVANQYADFLKASGYEILPGNYIGMTNMMPEKQITIGKAPDHYEITIAPGVF